MALLPYVPRYAARIEYPAPCPRCGQMVTWVGWQPFAGTTTTVEPQCGRCGNA